MNKIKLKLCYCSGCDKYLNINDIEITDYKTIKYCIAQCKTCHHIIATWDKI